MKYILIAFCLITTSATAQLKTDAATLAQLKNEILTNSAAYSNLHYLCKEIGPRLSGSPQANQAVWATLAMLKKAGADTAYVQPVMVPHWVRGNPEQAVVHYGGLQKKLAVCALGMSIGTQDQGLQAPIVMVNNFDELHKLSNEAVKGKIVFFNYPMQPTLVGGGYGDAVKYRATGPVEAAKKGAIAVMIRSVTHALDYLPHTGTTKYEDGITKIPAFACSTMDAEWLSALLKNDKKAELFLYSNCSQLPDALSYNVIGEIRGNKYPEEIIVTGGHLDSWDLAEGAHDDGSGCVQAIEVLRSIKAAGLKPARTIRAVMYMNEENGLAGGNAYADSAANKNEHHIFAIESDAGGFGVQTIGISGTDQQFEAMQNWSIFFRPYGIYELSKGGGGADIGPLKSKFSNIVFAGVNPGSQRYFDHHHAPNDVFEAVNKRELELGAFGMAAICWLVSKYGVQ